MSVKIPCSSVNATKKYSNQGTLYVAEVVAPGRGVFDPESWFLSLWDTAGREIDWERAIEVGDTLHVETNSGYQTVTLDSTRITEDSHWAFTVVDVDSEGTLEPGQPTGVWKVTDSAMPCAPNVVVVVDADPEPEPEPEPEPDPCEPVVVADAEPKVDQVDQYL